MYPVIVFFESKLIFENIFAIEQDTSRICGVTIRKMERTMYEIVASDALNDSHHIFSSRESVHVPCSRYGQSYELFENSLDVKNLIP